MDIKVFKSKTMDIQEQWEGLSQGEREALKNFAYYLLSREQAYQSERFDQIIDDILDCIERSDPDYQQSISEAIEEAMKPKTQPEYVTGGMVYEWLTSLIE